MTMKMLTVHPDYGFALFPRPSDATCAVIGKHVAPLPCEFHATYPHCDGRVPFCDNCGKDEAGREPIDLFVAYGSAPSERTGRHHAESPFRVQTAEMHIARVQTAEFEMPFNVDVPTDLLPVVDEFAPSWSDEIRAHMMTFVNAGVPMVEPDDILIDSVDDDPCIFCGSDTGTCVASCVWGGEA